MSLILISAKIPLKSPCFDVQKERKIIPFEQKKCDEKNAFCVTF